MTHPLWLLALPVALAWVSWLAWKSDVHIQRWRRVLAYGLRVLVVTAVVLTRTWLLSPLLTLVFRKVGVVGSDITVVFEPFPYPRLVLTNVRLAQVSRQRVFTNRISERLSGPINP